MKLRSIRQLGIIVTLGVAFSLAGCETLRSLVSVQRPEVRVTDVAVSELSFEGAEITVGVAVDNPNPVGISMQGFSYELLVEDNSFIGGDVSEPIEIAPMDSASLHVPVAFGFAELRDTVQSLGDANTASYTLELTLRFELPVVGSLSIPVQKEGTFPVVKRPSLEVRAVRLESIGLSGADLRLEVTIDNPNSFGVTIQSLAYDFAVDRTPWVDGMSDHSLTIDAERETVISLPFTLRFLSIGRAVRDMLTGQDTLDYSIDVTARVETALALIPTVDIPLSRSGTVPLRR